MRRSGGSARKRPLSARRFSGQDDLYAIELHPPGRRRVRQENLLIVCGPYRVGNLCPLRARQCRGSPQGIVQARFEAGGNAELAVGLEGSGEHRQGCRGGSGGSAKIDSAPAIPHVPAGGSFVSSSAFQEANHLLRPQGGIDAEEDGDDAAKQRGGVTGAGVESVATVDG